MALPGVSDPLSEAGKIDAGLLVELLENRRASNQKAGPSSDVVGPSGLLNRKLGAGGGAAFDQNVKAAAEAENRPETDTDGWLGFEASGTETVGITPEGTDRPPERTYLLGEEDGRIAASQGQLAEDLNGQGKHRKLASWLDDPLVEASLLQREQGPAILAFAKGGTVSLAVVPTPDSAGSITSKGARDLTKHSPNLSGQIWALDSKCEALESVTALEWLSLPEGLDSGAEASDINILRAWLCLGTSLGYARFFQVRTSSSGLETALILSQRFHRAPVVNLHLRASTAGMAAGDSLQELSVVYPGALVAVQASDLVSVLKMDEPPELASGSSPSQIQKGAPMERTGSLDPAKKQEAPHVRRRKGQGAPVREQQSRPTVTNAESQSSQPGAPSGESTEANPDISVSERRKSAYLPFLKWKFAIWNAVSDAVIMGVRPGSLLGGFVEEPVYAVVVVGAKPSLAFYDAPIKEEAESMLSKASGVATKVGSAVYSSASSVLSLGKTLQPKMGTKLFDLRNRQAVRADGEAGSDMGPQASPAPGTGVNITATISSIPLQGLQKAVADNLGAAAASVNTAAANMVSVGPAGLGRQLAASVSARSASLGSLTTGLGLREKLRTSLGIKASRSLETVQSLESEANLGQEDEPPAAHDQPELVKHNEIQAEVLAERDRAERMLGVPASLAGSLDDPPRKGLRVWMAPRGSLGAVVDSLGRVCLIDGLGEVVLRVWKGYRDAQCAWTAKERQEQVDLCLAIYAPRRGVLEVWAVPYGPKLAASDCGYGCRLLHGSVDLKTTELEDRGFRQSSLATACLVRPDGRICTVRY
ncbi:hypothetical protein KFL_000010230 [Klebsormidium nitens]|uniref:Rab3-GAP regulatory subunit N-terminal domain-containing protein n=1 Tax=Klebsormidium nitens TaxID=105231 RepID=A0A0U9HHH6_KLENI|nr:hypothetical protein KFL_000010230 [Klebsormidium nitens]|eukprot:GAQ77574.1 hypothetical protein KFL_000010230 [Klebsormidium nitens]